MVDSLSDLQSTEMYWIFVTVNREPDKVKSKSKAMPVTGLGGL
jgi:hypothetical protein